MRCRGAAPDPGLGAAVELRGRYGRGLVDRVVVGEGLPGEGGAAEEAPPGLLQVQPARGHRDEDLLHARVLREPVQDRRALVAGEVVGDHAHLPLRVRRRDCLE